jgi:hypothetical protein
MTKPIAERNLRGRALRSRRSHPWYVDSN